MSGKISENLSQKLQESAAYIRKKIGANCTEELGVVLGSGFAKFAEEGLQDPVRIDFASIPHMQAPKVKGHGSSMVFGKVDGRNVCVLSGRIHLYEGHSLSAVVYPVRLMHALGIRKLIVTNASGGLRADLKPGSALLLKDQINFTGMNCLCETPVDFGPSFVDMVNAYDKEWRTSVLAKHRDLQEGIYIGALGPTYETPAETRMFGLLGGDAIGMSTVQEVIAARQINMRVLGITLVTNLAGGLSSNVNHQEVLAMGKERANYLQTLLLDAIKTGLTLRP